MERNIIIVGAGIAGLSAGCYARMNGFKTRIFEMHSIPGGLCAAWKRKGYTWDISMHFMTNSRRGPFHPMWKELGVVGERAFHYHREHLRIESGNKTLTIGADRNELQKAMLAISPADSKAIKKFLDLIFGKSLMEIATMKPSELFHIGDTVKLLLRLIPHLGVLKYSKSTFQEFAGQFQDPFLSKAVRFMVDAPGWPMLRFPTLAMSGFLQSSMIDAGAPQGGSHQVVCGIADRFKELGGEISFKTRVKELIIEQNRVCGVRLENGEEHRADMVIWAADGHHLIYDMLKGAYTDTHISSMYDTWTPVQPLVHVMMGVNRDLSKEPHRVLIETDTPITIADEEHRWLSVLHHCFDPSMAPSGKSAVEVWYATRYDYWEELYKDSSRYKSEKERIAQQTIAVLNKRWPGFADQVEVVDVPTPVTYSRYTGNWQGSPDGWYVTPENLQRSRKLRTLPGLSDLYMVGQWTAPFTGTVLAALSGRQTIELICKKENKRFFTSK